MVWSWLNLISFLHANWNVILNIPPLGYPKYHSLAYNVFPCFFLLFWLIVSKLFVFVEYDHKKKFQIKILSSSSFSWNHCRNSCDLLFYYTCVSQILIIFNWLLRIGENNAVFFITKSWSFLLCATINMNDKWDR